MKEIPAKIIESCGECSYRHYNAIDGFSYCTNGSDIRLYSQIPSNADFPSWCPLPDYKGWQDKPDKLYREAWELWGEESQQQMIIEECAELIVALSKYNRKVNGSLLTNIAEEIADVEICIEQIKLMKGLDEAVLSWRVKKLDRFKQLIEHKATMPEEKE